MQIEIVVINDRLSDSKVSLKFRIPTIYNFERTLPMKFSILLKK